MKSKKLNDMWEEDLETQKITAINAGILMLTDILIAKQRPVRLRSCKAGTEVIVGIKQKEKQFDLSPISSFPQKEYNEGTVPILKKALENGSCTFLTKEELEKMHNFFTGLEIEVE